MTKIIKTPYKVGDRFKTSMVKDLKIIAIAENYIMCRYMACPPFVKPVKDFQRFLKFIGAVNKDLTNLPPAA
jgi:hypothetical protein